MSSRFGRLRISWPRVGLFLLGCVVMGLLASPFEHWFGFDPPWTFFAGFLLLWLWIDPAGLRRAEPREGPPP
jgi:hypothetical protein